MNAWKVTIAIAAAIVFGYVTGVVGTIIQHRNETKFGASSRQFQYEWLVLPATPGFLLAEFHAGYDWGVDEAWTYQREIRLWNAAFWTGVAFIFIGPLSLRSWLKRQSGVHAKGPSIRCEF